TDRKRPKRTVNQIAKSLKSRTKHINQRFFDPSTLVVCAGTCMSAMAISVQLQAILAFKVLFISLI
ncbi:hypothetical protein, partial [Gluconobacter oxydans]|uniref:hypothetical protein n=1 Tax=Gluconobacter oxydans TaxID=442 RepID=UPI0020A13101